MSPGCIPGIFAAALFRLFICFINLCSCRGKFLGNLCEIKVSQAAVSNPLIFVFSLGF